MHQELKKKKQETTIIVKKVFSQPWKPEESLPAVAQISRKVIHSKKQERNNLIGASKARASRAYCTPARMNNDNMTLEFFQGVEAVKHQGYIVINSLREKLKRLKSSYQFFEF